MASMPTLKVFYVTVFYVFKFQQYSLRIATWTTTAVPSYSIHTTNIISRPIEN